MRNKTTLISLSTIILLALIHTGFYYWAKSKFLKAHESIVKDLIQEGFTIQDNAPITFSGFPFKLIAHQDNFKAVRRTAKGYTEIDSIHATANASILNPLKWEVKASIQIQGLMTPPALPTLQAALTKKALDANVNFKLNEHRQPIQVDLMVPHLIVKLKPGLSETNIRSLRLYNFKVKWEDPKIKHIKYIITAEMAKCSHKPYAEDSFDGQYKFKFYNLDIQKFDSQAKWQGHVSLPDWRLNIKVRNLKSLQNYIDALNIDFQQLKLRYKSPAKEQKCALYKMILDKKDLLKAIDTSLEISSKIKRDEGVCNVEMETFKKDNKSHLKLSMHIEQAEAIIIDLVTLLTQPLPHVLDIFKTSLKKSEAMLKDWKWDTEVDLLDTFTEFYHKSC